MKSILLIVLLLLGLGVNAQKCIHSSDFSLSGNIVSMQEAEILTDSLGNEIPFEWWITNYEFDSNGFLISAIRFGSAGDSSISRWECQADVWATFEEYPIQKNIRTVKYEYKNGALRKGINYKDGSLMDSLVYYEENGVSIIDDYGDNGRHYSSMKSYPNAEGHDTLVEIYEKGTLEDYNRMKYDGKGRLIKDEEYLDNSLYYTFYYNYSENQLEEISASEDDTTHWQITKYDEYGNDIEIIFKELPNQQGAESSLSYTYQFDNKNNWIVKTHLTGKTHVTINRRITFDE